MKKKISIIVPIYNSEKYLKKCIDSILQQTYYNLEILLIDDGSTDKSKKICDEYKKKDSRIVFLSKNNTGVADTRNFGIKNSTGEYIGFVDSDDFIEKNMFENLINNIIIYNADISICNFINNKEEKKENGDVKVLDRDETLKSVLVNDEISGFLWNKLYKKEILENFKIELNKNISICEDLLFNCNYIKNIKKAVFTEQRLYHYIKRIDSAVNGQFNNKHLTLLDAYDKMIPIYQKENIKIYDYFKAFYVLANVNIKTKMFLNNVKNEKIKERCNKNINKYLKEVLKTPNLSFKLRTKVFIYYYFHDAINILKKILKKV